MRAIAVLLLTALIAWVPGGSQAFAQDDDEVVVTLVQLNNAPVYIDGTNNDIILTASEATIQSFPGDSSYYQVTLPGATWATYVDDPDLGATLGFAVTAWGASVMNPAATSAAAALVYPLPATDLVIKVQAPGAAVAVPIMQARVWDRTDGATTTGNATVNGGRNAYSANIKWLTFAAGALPPPGPPPHVTMSAIYGVGNGMNSLNTGLTINAIAQTAWPPTNDVGMMITDVPTLATPGYWQYRQGLGAWTALPAIPAGDAMLLDLNASLRYVPTGNPDGTQPGGDEISALTMRGWLVHGAQGASGTVVSQAGITATTGSLVYIDVHFVPVNDPPSAPALAPTIINTRTAVTQSIPNTSASAGPDDEIAQTVTWTLDAVTESTLGTAIQTASTTMHPTTGAIGVALASGSSGALTVDYHLVDSGGTANNGENTSGAMSAIVYAAPVTTIAAPYPRLSDVGTNPFNVGSTADGLLAIMHAEGAQRGIIITGVYATTDGHLEYQLVTGGPWTTVPAIPAGSGLLLDHQASLRWVPDLGPGGTRPEDTHLDALLFQSWEVAGDQAASGTVVALAGRPDLGYYAYADVHVIPVNEPPAAIDPITDISVSSGAGAVVVAVDGGLDPGASWESAQVTTPQIVAVTTSTPGMFSVAPAFNGAGDLTFTPNPAVPGLATITWHVTDDGGVAYGGSDTSATYTVRILSTSNAVIAAPYALTNTGINPTNTGATIADLVADYETSGLPAYGIAITGLSVSTPAGTWQYRIGAGAWTDFPAIGSGDALLLDATSAIRFAPSGPSGPGDRTQPDVTITDALAVRLWMVDGSQAASGTVTTLASLGELAALALDGFDVHLVPVNDEPSAISPVTTVSVSADAGAQTVVVMSGTNAGAPDEGGQVRTAQVVSASNAALFAVQPAFDGSNQLTFTSAPGASGMSTITWVVADDGGVLNGGDDRSPDYTITLLVSPSTTIDAPYARGNSGVNPTNTGLAISDLSSQIAGGASPAYGVAITGISGSTPAGTWQYSTGAGAWTDFPLIPVARVLLLDNTALIRFVPTGAVDGSQPDVVLASALSWSLWTVDGPQVESGTVVTTASHAADIVLTLTDAALHLIPVNDEPSAVNPTEGIAREIDAGPQVAAVMTSAYAGAPDESGQSIVAHVVSVVAAPGFFATAPAFDASNQLTWAVANGQTGTAVISWHLIDSGGVARDGDDTSPTYQTTLSVAAATTVAAPYSLGNAAAANPTNVGVAIQDILDTYAAGLPYAVVITDLASMPPGDWEYRTGAGTWSLLPALLANRGVVLNGGDHLRFVPAAPSVGSLDQPDLTVTDAVTWEIIRSSSYATGSTVVISTLGTNRGWSIPSADAHLIPVNDRPSAIGPVAIVAQLVDAGPQNKTVMTGVNLGAPDEASQTATPTTVTVTAPGGYFAVAPTFVGGQLSYTVAAGQTGTATVTWHLTDDGGVAYGGNPVSITYTTTIRTVEPGLIEAPYARGNSGANPTNIGSTVADIVLGYSGGADNGILITDTSGTTAPGTWQYRASAASVWTNWPAIPAGSALRLDNAAEIRFVPDGPGDLTQPDLSIANALAWQIWDVTGSPLGSGTVATLASIGAEAGLAMAAPTLHLIPVNDQPDVTGVPSQVFIASGATTDVQLWTGSDPGAPDETGQTITGVLEGVTSNNPTLLAGAVSFTGADTVSIPTAPGQSGTVTVLFHVEDDGGTAYDGNPIGSTHSVQVFITPPPVVTSIYAVANAATPNPSNVGRAVADMTDPIDGTERRGLLLSDLTSPEPGTWQYRTASYNAWNTLPAVPAGSVFALDYYGEIRFVPTGIGATQPDGAYPASAHVRLWDVYGAQFTTGQVLTLAGLGSAATVEIAPLTLSLVAVNDVPGVVAPIAASHVSADFFSISTGTVAIAGGASPGPSDESAQTITWQLVSQTPSAVGLLSSPLTINPATGEISYAIGVNRSGTVDVVYRVQDSGGVAYGGIDLSPTQTFQLIIDAAPVPPGPGVQAMTAIYARGNTATPNPFNLGRTVQDLTAASGRSDDGLLITGFSASMPAGAWQYRLGAGAWAAIPAIPVGSAFALDQDGSLRFVPTGDADGSQPAATILQAVQAVDWVAGGPQATTGTVVTLASVALTIGEAFDINLTLVPVNDAPLAISPATGATVSSDPDVIVTGTVPVATGAGAGAPDESTQTLTFVLDGQVPSNGSLLVAPITLDPVSGVISYQIAANQTGTVTVTYHVADDGGTALDGQDASATYQFVLTVAPGMPPGPGTQTISGIYALGNAPTPNPFNTGRTVADLLSATGRTGEGVLVTAVNPTNPAGTWQFRIGAGAWAAVPAIPAGSALALDDRCALRFVPTGPLQGAQPASTLLSALTCADWLITGTQTVAGTVITQASVAATTGYTFAITLNVIPVNDQPTVNTPSAGVTLVSHRATVATGAVAPATGADAGAPDESAQTLTWLLLSQTPSAGGLLTAPLTMDSATGAITYAIAAGAAGTVSVTYAVQDDGLTAYGGIDTSATQTFVFTIAAPATPPAPGVEVLESIYAPENAATPNVDNVGRTVTSLVDATAATTGVAITAFPQALPPGIWQYRIGAGVWTDFPAIAAGSALLLDTTSSIRYVPSAALPDGSQSDEVVLDALHASNWLLTGAQAASGTVQTMAAVADDLGGELALTVDMVPVNAQPSALGVLTTVDLVSAAVPVSGSVDVASGANVGPSSEAWQTPQFGIITQSTSVAGLLASPVTMDPVTGRISYSLAPGADGTIDLVWRVQDDGGTLHHGTDRSVPYATTITVRFTPPPVVPVGTFPCWYALRNLGMNPTSTGVTVEQIASVAGLADIYEAVVITGIDDVTVPGTVQYLLPGGFWRSVDRTTLAGKGIILPLGSRVRFGPRGDTATGDQWPVTAQDVIEVLYLAAWPGNPGAILPGQTIPTVDYVPLGYYAGSLAWNCIPINNAPVIIDRRWTIHAPINAPSTTGTAFGSIRPGPNSESWQAVTMSESSLLDPQSIFAVPPVLNIAGTVTFTPKANVSGSAVFNYRAHDNGGTDHGGVDTTLDIPIILTVGDAISPPIVDPPEQTIYASPGVPTTITIRAYEPQNQSVAAAYRRMSSIGAVLSPIKVLQQSAMRFTPATVSFTYTPTVAGTETLSIAVANEFHLEAVAKVHVVVADPGTSVDRPRIVSRPPYFWSVGKAWTYTIVTERERLGQTANLTYEVITAPVGSVMSGNTIFWDPSFADEAAGTGDVVFPIIIKAINSTDQRLYDTIRVLIAPEDRSLRGPRGPG